MTGLPDPAPRRSRVAAWLAVAVAAVSLLCAALAWAAASPARSGAAARLLDRDDGLAEYHLLLLDEIVRFRFHDLAVAYLAVAVLFAALAVAVRIGPRWSVVLIGTLSATGVLIVAWVGFARLLTGIPPLAGWSGEDLLPLLAETTPAWFLTAEQLPLLATFAGLPIILALLVVGHFRSQAEQRAGGPGLGW